MNSRHCGRSNDERGQTIVLVAFCLMAMFAFAALAIDVTTLYVAHNQAQQAADAAALAGAQAFVVSGYTSGFVTQTAAQTLATQQATAAGQQVSVGGRNLQASEIAVSFPTSTQNNPLIAVTISRAGVPTFFAKIWGVRSTTVTGSAKAEAYNPSGLGSASPNVQVTNPKPFALPNCNPNNPGALGTGPCQDGSQPFFDPNNNYAILGPTTVVGQLLTVTEQDKNAGQPIAGKYYAIDLPVSSTSVACPATNQVSCGSVSAGAPGYFESIACTNSVQLSCGQTFNVDPNTGALHATSNLASMCLIHAQSYGFGSGQDTFCTNSTTACPPPIDIDGGGNNPDPSLRNVNGISRSDSIVTLPVWNGSDLCPGGICGTGTIIGFLQVAIRRVRNPTLVPPNGGLGLMVLNAVGCGNAPTTAVSGSTASPIPVRLVN